MEKFEKNNLLFSLQAEESVLGALLYNNLLYEKILFLEKNHFYLPLHREIFECIVKMIYKGELATPITIAPLFKENNIIKDRGEAKYWVSLVSNVGPIANINANAKYIYELYLRRCMQDISSECFKEAQEFNIDYPVEKIIESTEMKIFNLSNVEKGSKKIDFKNLLIEVVEQAEVAAKKNSMVGVASNLEKLDKHLGGFHKSDLIILAGRPSMGKTSLATAFAFNAAKNYANNQSFGAKTCFFSLEMSASQLALRILGQESQIPSDRIRRGATNQAEIEKIKSVSKTLYEIPLFIDDTPAITIAGLRTRARRLMRQEKIGLIVIDYLQLLRSDKSNENRVQELSEITRGLKAIAKELDIPIIALSQLSRAVEQREDKQPQLSDLRESGSIEQDADVVMFVYREAYYESRKKPNSGSEKMQEWQLKMSKIYNKADIIIAKQRHGPIGTIGVHFEESTTKFSNLYEEREDF